MANLIWLVPIFPLLGVLINGLVLQGAARKKYAGWVATAMAAASFVVAILIALDLKSILAGSPYRDSFGWSWIEAGDLRVPMALRIDPLSLTMMFVVTGVGSLIHLFSVGYMADDERVGRYFTYLNLFLFSMLVLVLANSYPLMFVGWEGVGLCSFLLIGFWFERIAPAQAGKKAFIINRVGDVGFLLAMFAVFHFTGSLTFNDGGNGALDQAQKLLNNRLWGISAIDVVCLLFFLACTGKSAQLPLYLWLPDAMEGPTPVSALIHAATMVTAGVYLVARSAPLFSLSPTAQQVVAWTGVITAAFAAIIAVKQYDIKRVLAYSTVSQLGYMFVGVGIGAYAAGIFHLITHAFFKALMFLGAGAVMHALEGQLDMRKMGNVRKYMPVTFGTFAVGWWAICGLPPFSGFFSKDMILEHAYETPWGRGIYWIGVATAALTAFYMTRMFVTVFFGSERIELGDEGHGGDAQEHGPSNLPGHPAHGESRSTARDAVHAHADHHGHTHDHGHAHDDHAHGAHGPAHVHPEQPVMNLPLIVLAVLAAAGGALVNFLPHFLDPVTVGMVPAVGAEHAEAAAEAHKAWTITGAMSSTPTWISIAAGALGVLVAWLGFGPEKFARGWGAAGEAALGFLQNAYDGTLWFIFVKGGDAFAQLLYWFDKTIVDGAVNGAAWVTEYLADSLRTLQTGYVRNYALVMLAGAVFVVACFMVILQQLSPNLMLIILGAAVAVIVVLGLISAIGSRIAPKPSAESIE